MVFCFHPSPSLAAARSTLAAPMFRFHASVFRLLSSLSLRPLVRRWPSRAQRALTATLPPRLLSPLAAAAWIAGSVLSARLRVNGLIRAEIGRDVIGLSDDASKPARHAAGSIGRPRSTEPPLRDRERARRPINGHRAHRSRRAATRWPDRRPRDAAAASAERRARTTHAAFAAATACTATSTRRARLRR